MGFIVFIICLIASVAGCFYMIRNHKELGKKRTKIIAIASVFVLLAGLMLGASIHTVDTGTVAVVKHLGEARGVRTAGTHFDFFLTESYQRYDVKVQNLDILTQAYSGDAQTMDISMTLQYQVMGDRVVDIAQQYGALSVLESRITSIAIEKTKAVLSKNTAMEIIANRSSMSPLVEEAIKEAIGESYHVNVVTVVITDISFTDAFETAVENKMIAEQNKLKAEYENQTRIAQTEADAQAKLIAAEADAKAKIVAAEAEAKANELLERSLTDRVLRKLYLEKWNGELPRTMLGAEANVMIGAE